jgi:hypothetical protein
MTEYWATAAATAMLADPAIDPAAGRRRMRRTAAAVEEEEYLRCLGRRCTLGSSSSATL